MWLTVAGKRRGGYRKEPSPAQTATKGWYVLGCVTDTRVDYRTSRTCGLLRLGVKRYIQYCEGR